MHYWNEWFTALLFIDRRPQVPAAAGAAEPDLERLVHADAADSRARQATPVYQLRLALTAVTIGPILLAYPFAQRYFVKGITLGATKG